MRVIVLNQNNFGFILLGLDFCCRKMQASFEMDPTTGLSFPGRPVFFLVWKYKGEGVEKCPFCGGEVTFEIKEESDLVVPTAETVTAVERNRKIK